MKDYLKTIEQELQEWEEQRIKDKKSLMEFYTVEDQRFIAAFAIADAIRDLATTIREKH